MSAKNRKPPRDARVRAVRQQPGLLEVLSVGHGHLKLTITPDDPIELEKARAMIEDMLARGASIFVHTSDGETRRVKRFDPAKMVYYIDPPDPLPAPAESAQPVQEERTDSAPPAKRPVGRPRKYVGVPVEVVNYWYSRSRRAHITLYRQDGTLKVLVDPRAQGAERITYWLSTIGASQAWSYEAELEARRKLATMIKPHLMQMYEMTGSFLETSARSGVSYILRRARPTVAMVPIFRDRDDLPMKVLAVLCLHPLGYYKGTWAGCMVPTDDVIAHLTYIRGDEPGFWRRANQHPIDSAEAGL